MLPLGEDHPSNSKILARVLSRIYHLGEKSEVGKGHELPRGGGGVGELRCNLVHFERIIFEKCYSVCTDFVASV